MTAAMASSDDTEGPTAPPSPPSPLPTRPASALPSVQARVMAFAAIAVAGVFGGLIGFSTVKVGCHQNCSTPEGIGGVGGAVMAAVGVAVIAVLVLRAMGEWRTIKEDRALEVVAAAATAFRQPQAPAAPPPAAPPPAAPPPAADPPAPPPDVAGPAPDVAGAVGPDPGAGPDPPS
jgi:hypothetical protein